MLKNKLFFFTSFFDGYRFDSATPPTPQTIPTLAERNGDFTAFATPIYDPSICLATNSSLSCISRPQISCVVGGVTVLNYICPNRISNVAKSFQSYLPTTNYDGTPLGTGTSGNYLSSLPNLVNNDSGTAKVDYDLTSKNRISAVFSRGKYANPLVGSLSLRRLHRQFDASHPLHRNGRGVIEYATLPRCTIPTSSAQVTTIRMDQPLHSPRE